MNLRKDHYHTDPRSLIMWMAVILAAVPQRIVCNSYCMHCLVINWSVFKYWSQKEIQHTRVNFLHQNITTFSNGCLGCHIDEERSEMRYVTRIARPCESLKFWTHIVLPGISWKHACLSVSEPLSEMLPQCNFSGLWTWSGRKKTLRYIFVMSVDKNCWWKLTHCLL